MLFYSRKKYHFLNWKDKINRLEVLEEIAKPIFSSSSWNDVRTAPID